MTEIIAQQAEQQAQAMLATAGCDFNDAYTFAPAIHDFARQGLDLGKEGAAYRSDLLRAALLEQGGFAPEGNFLFYGGMCIPTPALFLSREERMTDAEGLAREILSAAYTTEEAETGEARDIMCLAAAMDDEELQFYGQAFERLYKEKYGPDSYAWSGDPMAILSDGSVLSMSYIFSDDGYAEEDE